MRYPRIKPSETDTFMHVYNRVAGSAGDFLFGPAEKEEFIRRLRRLTELYSIEVISYQCMGNHFHATLYIPAEPPSPEETARRYRRYYRGKRFLDAQSPACAKLALKPRDVSEFMKDLQQPFTRWYNRTRPVRRRGHLWADRFKNTVLENGLAVWDCWKYVEMNAVRACMVTSPAGYRFCSFGQWVATGAHPFEETLKKRLLSRFKGLLDVDSVDEIRIELQKEFARISAVEARRTPEQIETAIAVAAEKERFTTRVDWRVRYWVDGLVIGSELFVRDTMARARVQCRIHKRKLVRAVGPNSQKEDLYCFKQLRLLLQ
jgi:hypothetical protein